MDIEKLELIILGHIAIELGCEIEIGRQVKLAENIFRSLQRLNISISQTQINDTQPPLQYIGEIED